MVPIRALLFTTILLTACGEEEEITQVAEICVGPSQVGSPIPVTVQFETCLSSSCDTVKEVACSVTQDGDAWWVDGFARIERKSGSCTDDCGSVTAECTFEAPEEGGFTLQTDGISVTYVHPGAEALCGFKQP